MDVVSLLPASLIPPKDFISIGIWLFTMYDDPRYASMAEWLKRPTHNWQIRRSEERRVGKECRL